MKFPLLLILLFCFSFSHSQVIKDTAFQIRGYSCSCKFVVSGQADIKPFDLHEQAPAYPGGEEEWKKFLKKNLDKSLKGKDKVELRFLVSAGGDLSGFTILNHAPAQKFEEVVRVLRLSGKWFPGVRNGYCVAGDVSMTAEL